MMSGSVTDANRTPAGVSFRIRLRTRSHAFLISRETLDGFAARHGIDTSDADDLEVFHAFEATIARAAQEQIRRGSESCCVLTMAALRSN